MSQGRGDLGPGSYSLLWFLHSKLRFKRQRLSLHYVIFDQKTRFSGLFLYSQTHESLAGNRAGNRAGNARIGLGTICRWLLLYLDWQIQKVR